jgi:putative flippase GtrA
LADAGLLAVLVHGVGSGPIVARAVSFPAAVLLTFLLNRFWAFADAERRSALGAFFAYLLTQAAGIFCNLLVYTAGLAVLPWPLAEPVICLAIASAAALVVNYAGLRLLVFRKRASIEAPTPS